MKNQQIQSRIQREGRFHGKTSRKGKFTFNRKLIKSLKLREMGLGFTGTQANIHVVNYLRSVGLK